MNTTTRVLWFTCETRYKMRPLFLFLIYFLVGHLVVQLTVNDNTNNYYKCNTCAIGTNLDPAFRSRRLPTTIRSRRLHR